jgi:F5/8 type C domain
MSANPIWIAGYFGPVAGAVPVWIAPGDGTVPSAVQSEIVSYYAPVAGATAVWIAGFFAPPPAAIGATPITISGWGGSGGGGSGGSTSVWSADDAAANAMTLSNGGLTLTADPTSTHWDTVRATTSKTSGKLYIEFSCISGNPLGPYIMFGFADASFNVINTYLGSGNYSCGIQTDSSGPATVSSGFTSNYSPVTGNGAIGDVWGLAIDFAAGAIWIAQNNVWVNASNPASGSLPAVSFVPATVGALFAAMSMRYQPGNWTLQPTAASQKYAPPSGFSAWDSAAPAVTGHRYWRLNMTATTGSAYAMAEVQFRTTAGTPLLFSGGTASASTIYGAGYEADKATDNNPTTMWISSLAKLASQTWTYDYGAGVTKAIVEIMIQARSDVPQGPDTFTPQWSDDGTTWTSMTPITTTWAAGQIQVFPVTPATHSSQALAYLARTVGGDEGGNGANIATLIDGLVSDGVWAKLDALYVLAQQNQSDALLNLIGTSYGLAINNALAASDPRISNVVFTSYKGFSGFSPGAGFLDTGLNAVMASGLHYTQNSASFGAWSYATTSDQNAIMGTGSVTQIFDNYAGSVFYARTNNASVSSVPTSITKGLFVGDRPDASNVFPYQNGVSAGAIGAASQAMDNSNFWIGGAVGQGVTAQTLSAAFIGASLGAAGQLALYNRLRTYMTSIGVP